MSHRFVHIAPHLEELLSVDNLKDYVLTSRRLAETPEAIRAYEIEPSKIELDPEDLEKLPDKPWSPGYFGDAGEFLAECFLRVYGAEWAITNIKSTADIESSEKDLGIDHTAINMHTGSQRFQSRCQSPEDGSPVYIQTKFSKRFDLQHHANDGSRLTNFFSYAHSLARQSGHLYQMRLILVTTKRGLGDNLKEMTGDIIEVINGKKIAERIDGRTSFFDFMRTECGIQCKSLKQNSSDIEYQILKEKVYDLEPNS